MILYRSPGVLDYIQAVTKIHLAPSISIIETGLQSAADELTKAAEDIYEKYGEGALNALETKFQGIKDVRNTLKVFTFFSD